MRRHLSTDSLTFVYFYIRFENSKEEIELYNGFKFCKSWYNSAESFRSRYNYLWWYTMLYRYRTILVVSVI